MFCRVVHLLTISVDCSQLIFPVFSAPVSRNSETWHPHGMIIINHEKSTQRTEAAFGLFLPCVNKKSINATHSPLNLYSKTLLLSEKSYRIQYITFCFTSLELQNERVGNRIKNLPSLHWIWFSVGPHRNQRAQLNCIPFFVGVPPCPQQWDPRRQIKAWS